MDTNQFLESLNNPLENPNVNVLTLATFSLGSKYFKPLLDRNPKKTFNILNNIFKEIKNYDERDNTQINRFQIKIRSLFHLMLKYVEQVDKENLIAPKDLPISFLNIISESINQNGRKKAVDYWDIYTSKVKPYELIKDLCDDEIINSYLEWCSSKIDWLSYRTQPISIEMGIINDKKQEIELGLYIVQSLYFLKKNINKDFITDIDLDNSWETVVQRNYKNLKQFDSDIFGLQTITLNYIFTRMKYVLETISSKKSSVEIGYIVDKASKRWNYLPSDKIQEYKDSAIKSTELLERQLKNNIQHFWKPLTESNNICAISEWIDDFISRFDTYAIPLQLFQTFIDIIYCTIVSNESNNALLTKELQTLFKIIIKSYNEKEKDYTFIQPAIMLFDNVLMNLTKVRFPYLEVSSVQETAFKKNLCQIVKTISTEITWPFVNYGAFYWMAHFNKTKFPKEYGYEYLKVLNKTINALEESKESFKKTIIELTEIEADNSSNLIKQGLILKKEMRIVIEGHLTKLFTISLRNFLENFRLLEYLYTQKDGESLLIAKQLVINLLSIADLLNQNEEIISFQGEVDYKWDSFMKYWKNNNNLEDNLEGNLENNLEMNDNFENENITIKEIIDEICSKFDEPPTILDEELLNKMENIFENSNWVNRWQNTITEQSDDENNLTDPISFIPIKKPIVLPDSKMILDETTILEHLEYNSNDPFTRAILTREQLIEFNKTKEAKEIIDKAIKSNRDDNN